jgi:hypothetical protein
LIDFIDRLVNDLDSLNSIMFTNLRDVRREMRMKMCFVYFYFTIVLYVRELVKKVSIRLVARIKQVAKIFNFLSRLEESRKRRFRVHCSNRTVEENSHIILLEESPIRLICDLCQSTIKCVSES